MKKAGKTREAERLVEYGRQPNGALAASWTLDGITAAW